MQILNSSLILAYFWTWREPTTITLSWFWRKYLTTGGCHMQRAISCCVALSTRTIRTFLLMWQRFLQEGLWQWWGSKKAEEISEARAVAKMMRPVVPHGDVEYQMKKARVEGMNSQIDKNNIANIFEQIKRKYWWWLMEGIRTSRWYLGWWMDWLGSRSNSCHKTRQDAMTMTRTTMTSK